MDSASLKFRSDRLNAFFGFVEGLRCGDTAKLPISAVLDARERKNRVQLLPTILELVSPSHKTRRGEERANEIKHLIRSAIRPLAFEKDSVETSPFGGLTGVVDEVPIGQHAGDVAPRTTLTENACQRFDLTFLERRCRTHRNSPPRISSRAPSVSFSSARMSARISSSVRSGCGL